MSIYKSWRRFGGSWKNRYYPLHCLTHSLFRPHSHSKYIRAAFPVIRPLGSYNPSGSYPCGRQKRPKCWPGSGFAREYRACPLPEENPTQDYITVSCTRERRRRTTTTAGSVSRIAEPKRVGEVSSSALSPAPQKLQRPRSGAGEAIQNGCSSAALRQG